RITVEEIKKHEVVLTQVAQEIKEAATGGKPLSEAVAELEKKYTAGAAAAKDPAVKRELSFAMAMLHQEQARIQFERQAKLNPKLPDWVVPFANRAMAGGSSPEQVAAGRQSAFDGAGSYSGDSSVVVVPDRYFQGTLKPPPAYTGPAATLS